MSSMSITPTVASEYRIISSAKFIVRKSVNAISSVALPVLFTLGVSLCTLHYGSAITKFLASKASLAFISANPLLVGGGLIVLGGILYLKRLLEHRNQIKPLEKLWEQRNQLPIEAGTGRYRFLENKKIDATGDVKSIQLGLSENYHEVIISVLSEEKKKDKFDTFFTPDAVVKAWQKSASENNGNGGVGDILGSQLVQGQNGRKQFLVQPFYNGDNLLTTLVKDEAKEIQLTKEDRINIFYDIFNGLRSLHKNGIVHRDLKSENIQLHWNGKRYMAFIIDTDLAQFGKPSKLDNDLGYEAKKKFLGNAASWSPEIIFEDDINKVDQFKSDVWALGLIAAMLFIEEPQIVSEIDNKISDISQNSTLDKQNLKKKLKDGAKSAADIYKRFTRWIDEKNITMLDPDFERFKNVIIPMLKPDPKERLTLEQLKPRVDQYVQGTLKNQ